ADGAAQAESQRAESRVSVRAPEAHVLAPHVPEARAPERAPEGAAVSPRRETPEVELPEGVVREGGAMGTSFFFVVPAQARGLGFEPRIHLGVDDGSGAALGLIAERAWGLSRRIDAAIEARHESRDVLRAEFDEDSGYDSVQAQAGRIQENEEGRAREGDKERRARHDEDVRRRNELVREGVRDNLEVQAELAETDEDLTYTEIGAFEVGDVMRASGLDNHWLSGNAYITPIPDLQPAPDAHQAFSAAEDPQAAAASDNEGLARQVGLPQPVMPEARANPHLSLLDEVLKPLPPMPE
ncbi:MAG: hypothetical protein KDJ49_06095, partial [Alphaproteobacteria bacterium]|nr:hypothetical protein [Alphaproteobacteria bacterium]